MQNVSLSVVVPTYNSAKTLEQLLKSIRQQAYNQKKIEIILADGGSTDDTGKIAKKYNAKLLPVMPRHKQSAEYNRAYGVYHTKNEILAFFDHDNILPHRNLLKNMTLPFLKEKDLVGVETLYYQYMKSLTALDRYFALFGVNDPLAFYLGKADRQSYIYTKYHLQGKAEYKDRYYLVKFSPDKIPTLGSNGFLIRKSTLMKHAHVAKDYFFHIDVNVDLIRKGFNTYAFIKDSIIHISNHGDFLAYLWRRKHYMEKYYVFDAKKRRYSVYERKDFGSLLVFIFISLTFIIPLYDSIRGYRKIHDVAWFLHPLMCFGTVVVYGYTYVRTAITKILQ